MRYKIYRFNFKGRRRYIRSFATLQGAQEHCQRDDTHGNGWFHGYVDTQKDIAADDVKNPYG